MTMLKVRVEVADVPGALAAITTALASLHVDVAAIDVLEVDGSRVVDDLLLRLPSGVAARDVQDVLRLAGAADVLSSRVTTSAVDATVAAFELARAALAAPNDTEATASRLARVANAEVAAVVGVGECGSYPLAQRALVHGIPAAGAATSESSPLGRLGGWVLWVAPQVAEPQHLVVVGRRVNVRFAATEAARLRAFATLLEEVRRVAV